MNRIGLLVFFFTNTGCAAVLGLDDVTYRSAADGAALTETSSLSSDGGAPFVDSPLSLDAAFFDAVSTSDTASSDFSVFETSTRDVVSEETSASYPPHCWDGSKNMGESDTDCGGACAKCATGRSCNIGSDCVSGSCSASNLCNP